MKAYAFLRPTAMGLLSLDSRKRIKTAFPGIKSISQIGHTIPFVVIVNTQTDEEFSTQTIEDLAREIETHENQEGDIDPGALIPSEFGE